MIDVETVETGRVGADVYLSYFHGVGGPSVVLLVLFTLVLSQGLSAACQFQLKTHKLPLHNRFY